ncbi:MAG: ABC transporter substrate-binding protein [Deltaproteobacteria bacterium]|nr:ABC transporter substrate-binding protein [Deltaproteobacteria bacterium]
MKRRQFLLNAGGVLAAVSASVAGCGEETKPQSAPNVITKRKYRWRMVTTWSPALDVLQGNAERYATLVENMSEGRLKIEVFAAGELVPALGAFDACQQGTIEMYNGAAYYWAGKEPATQWFTAVPFGLNAQGQYAWCFSSDGLKLWEETYRAFGLVPRPSASTGVQMGGWFRKKISDVSDFRGLKIRIPGLGGKVMSEAGASVVLTPPGDTFPALERGVIDAAEMVGPHDDIKLGLHRAARHYYYPGWQEPGSITEFVFNQKAYESLPSDLQRILDAAAMTIKTTASTEYDVKNAAALHRLQTDFRDKVEILQFPIEVMESLKKLAEHVNQEESLKSTMARKVYASYSKFQKLIQSWGEVSEAPYYKIIAG